MELEGLRTLYAHASWANGRVLEAASRLTQAQWQAPGEAGTASIGATLAHLVEVQGNWLARSRQVPTPPPLTADDRASAAALTARWRAIDAETHAHLARLAADDLTMILHYVNSRGVPQAYPRWQVLLHQVMHAAQHRAEAALLLTLAGHSPGGLDLLVFVDEERARPAAGSS